MQLSTRLAASALLLAALVSLGAATCDATADGPTLFRDSTREPATPLPDSPRVVRTRYVEVNFAALGGENPTPASAPATVLLNLFPDATFTAERDGAQPTGTGGGMVWSGHLQGIPNSAVTLVVGDGLLAGTISGGDRAYNVAYAGDGVYIVRELNPGAFPPD